MQRLVSTGVVTAIALLWASPASATWSVVGVDSETGEVGVAIASCVPADALGDLNETLVPVVLIPDVGAGVTQAALFPAAAVRIRELVEIGRTPEEIVGNLVGEEFDPDSALRQHAVVTFTDEAAGFTGAENSPTALDSQAKGVSVQGNILVSESVVDDALAAFIATADAPLAERLVAALVAGGEAGGDSRCGDQTALFAQLAVAKPSDKPFTPSILLTVGRPEGGESPVVALERAYRSGERQLTDAPATNGAGQGIGLIALALALLMIPAGVMYWRWSYRKPRY